MSPKSLQPSRKLNHIVTVVALVASAGAGCARAPEPEASDVTATSATAPSSGSEWRTLFDGTSLSAWRGYKSADVPPGWRVADGTFMKESTTGDIITKDQFGDFELEFEWRIGRGGNSGVFYRATEEYDRIYWSAPEYQLLDDPNARDGRDRLTSAGAAYGLYPAPEGVVKPAGEWNITRIVARDAHVEHWLNGQKLLEYELWSPDWEAKVKGSKFGAWAQYGRSRRGHIGIQGDHNGALAFRNVRIRELR